MSRPSTPNIPAPTFTVLEWAPDTNYAAGPDTWNGNACKVDPPGRTSVGFVPNQGNAAQYQNFAHNAWSTGLSDSKDALDAVVTATALEFGKTFEFVGQLAPLNFSEGVAPGGNVAAAVYDEIGRRWLVVGSAGNVRESFTQGWTWSGASLAAALTSEPCSSIDVDTAGNVVVACTGANEAFYRQPVAGAWARVTPASTAVGFAESVLCYDPVHALFVHIGTDSGGVYSYVRTSADAGATWTERTQWLDGMSVRTLVRLACNKISGRVLLAGKDAAGTSVTVASSDDGGVTAFVDRQTLATTIVGATDLALVHNPHSSEWLLTISASATSETWRSSDDGVSWTKVSTLAATGVLRPAPFGHSAWVATARVGVFLETVYSLDAGATWKFGDYRTTTSLGAVAGGGGVLLVGSSVYPSTRTGNPGRTCT